MTKTVKYRDLFPRKNYNILVYTEEDLVAAVLAEREACAKACMKQQYDLKTRQTFAAAIRARGEK